MKEILSLLCVHLERREKGMNFIMLRLKDLREDHDLKQEEIAKILNISQTNYSKYELEKVNIPIIL